MKALLTRAIEALARRHRERARVQALARLDARTLKDIGLESWQGELGAQVWSHRTGIF